MHTEDQGTSSDELTVEDHGERPQNTILSSKPTIKLIVGPDQDVFEVEEDLICQRCPFFFNAFAGDFLESKTRTITFPDDQSARFRDLFTWLQPVDQSPVNEGCTWINLAKLWLFAEKYHIDQLQNEIMDALYAKYVAHEEGVNISFETLDFVAEHTFPRSPLRGIFADMLTNGISLQQLPSRVEQIPPEFLQDMCIALKTVVSLNGPTNTSLLTHPLSTYYASSAASKACAMPKTIDRNDVSTGIHCDSIDCGSGPDQEPIKDVMHVCTSHNLTWCDDCRHEGHGHSRKMVSFTTAPYRDACMGNSTVIDCQVNDSGFYCDGPRCNPNGASLKHRQDNQKWAIMSGDRYHCLECNDQDYCSLCIRGDLECKDAGHRILRIRPTFSRNVPLTEQLSIKTKQQRRDMNVCWRCGSDSHETGNCEAKEPTLGADVRVED